jgi:hypothetical protein
MATRTTLLDIAKANGSDKVVGLIEEAIPTVPEITTVPARSIAGLNYKTLVRTSNFSGSTWRNANAGVTTGTSVYVNRLVETFILNPRWECDRAVADRYEDGPEVYAAMEGVGMINKAFLDLSRAFYYGTRTAYGGHASATPGLLDAYSTTMEVDALGSTDDVGSSVWGLKLGPTHVQWALGNNGSFELSELTRETIRDASSNPLPGYVQHLLAYPGLQVGSVFSAVRIKKITTDNTRGLTDKLLAAAVEKMEENGVGRPDVFFMSFRSRRQLQESRTVVINGGATGRVPGGAGNVAPTPTEYEGIPILATSGISNIEKLAL